MPQILLGSVCSFLTSWTYGISLTINSLLCVLCWVTQSCPTLCNPEDSIPLGSSVHGIIQARILEWGTISFSEGSSWPRNQTSISCVSCIAGGFFTCWTMLFTYTKNQEKQKTKQQVYELLPILSEMSALKFWEEKVTENKNLLTESSLTISTHIYSLSLETIFLSPTNKLLPQTTTNKNVFSERKQYNVASYWRNWEAWALIYHKETNVSKDTKFQWKSNRKSHRK